MQFQEKCTLLKIKLSSCDLVTHALIFSVNMKRHCPFINRPPEAKSGSFNARQTFIYQRHNQAQQDSSALKNFQCSIKRLTETSDNINFATEI